MKIQDFSIGIRIALALLVLACVPKPKPPVDPCKALNCPAGTHCSADATKCEPDTPPVDTSRPTSPVYTNLLLRQQDGRLGEIARTAIPGGSNCGGRGRRASGSS